MNPIPKGERLLCIGGPLDGQRMAFEGRDEMWAPAPPNLSSAPIVASAELPSPREDFGPVRYELATYCDLRGERTNLWVADSDKDSVFRRLVESYERASDVYGKELESRVEQMTRKIDELLNSRNLLKEENRKLVFAHVAAESEVTRLLSEVERLKKERADDKTTRMLQCEALTKAEAKVARLTNHMDRLRDIGEDMRNQDNLATACPVFMVQRRRRIYGMDPAGDYATVWLSEDGDFEADEAESAELEARYNLMGDDEHNGFRRLAYIDTWENVQPFFTRHGVARYLAVNGHNLRPETRIYVESGWRNQEWEDIRGALLALTEEEASNG